MRLYYEDTGIRGAVETARKQQLDDLCRRFRPALFAYFLRRVPDPAEAEDLAHDVFLRLKEMESRYRAVTFGHASPVDIDEFIATPRIARV